MSRILSIVKIISIIITIGLLLSGCSANLPDTPKNVKAIAYSSSVIVISWDPVSNADGYNLHLIPNVGGLALTGNKISITYTGVEISGLETYTLYSFRVTAYNSSGESSFSNIVTVRTFSGVPSAPTGISASAASESSIKINWSSVKHADGYKIYRSDESLGPYTEIGDTESISYTDTNLPVDVRYYYKVSAYNISGESAQSSSVYSQATTIPAPPSDVTATAESANSIIINWSAVYNADSYVIYRSLSESGVYTQIGTTTESSYLSAELIHETTYFYKVAAKNDIGEGDKSNSVSATTLSGKPNAPSYLSTSNITLSSIRISWSSVSVSATEYIVYRSLTDTNDYNIIATITSNIANYTDNGLSHGTTYYYKVLARNSYGDSPLSDAISATTASAIELTKETWTDGNLPTSSSEQWFSFTATAATQYIHVIFGTLDDLYVQLYDSSLNTVGSRTNFYGSTNYISRTLTIGQVYYIIVTPFSSSYRGGTYQIAFNSSITKPLPPLTSTIQLTEKQWADGDIPSSDGGQWFSFTATATTQYVHVIFGTLKDLYIQLYDSSLNTVGSRTNLFGSAKYISRTLTIGQVYYILVFPFSSLYKGPYKITFNTSATAPPQ